MNTARPPSWAERGVTLAAHVLPAGATRERYRQEFVAELYGPTRSRCVHARCGEQRLGAARGDLHTYSTEDGSRYRQCSRCGKYAPSINHPGDGSVSPTVL